MFEYFNVINQDIQLEKEKGKSVTQQGNTSQTGKPVTQQVNPGPGTFVRNNNTTVEKKYDVDFEKLVDNSLIQGQQDNISPIHKNPPEYIH